MNNQGISQKTLFWSIFIIELLVFCFIYQDFLTLKVTFTNDSLAWYPQFYFLFDSLVHGQLPLWNPYVLAGQPFFMDFQNMELLDPLIFLGVFLHKYLGFTYLGVYHFWYFGRLAILGTGVYFLIRYWCKSAPAALTASGLFIYAFAPVYFKQNGVMNVMLLAPWAFYFVSCLLDNLQNRRGYFYLTGLMLIMGFAANLYLPSYFLLEFALYLLMTFFCKNFRLSDLRAGLKNKKLVLLLGVTTVLAIMMTAPLLSAMHEYGPSGEAFPYLRVAQSYQGHLKKISATDSILDLANVHGESLGHFNSWGNILLLFVPHDWRPAFNWTFLHNPSLSETYYYFGLLGLIVLIWSICFSESRFHRSLVVMLLVTALITFKPQQWYGSETFVQSFVKILFPPAKYIEAWNLLGGYVLLFGFALMAFPIAQILQGTFFSRENSRRLTYITGIIMTIKFFLMNIETAVLSSLDRNSMDMLGLFLGFNYFNWKGRDISRVLKYFFFFAIFLDFSYFNYELISSQWAATPNQMEALIDGPGELANPAQFGLFRKPLARPNPSKWGEKTFAYFDNILHSKAAWPAGQAYTMFSTRRYYDFLTHVPLEKQFQLTLIRPIIEFYDASQVSELPKKEVLKSLQEEQDFDSKNPKLYIEDSTKNTDQTALSKIDSQALQGAEDIPWFDIRKTTVEFHYQFLTQHASAAQVWTHKTDADVLKNSHAVIHIVDFSNNHLNLNVENSTPGYLYFNDEWSQYWQAEADGKQVPVKIANYAFKAVFLDPGTHHVRFEFRPESYLTAVRLELIGALLLILLLVLFSKKLTLPIVRAE